MGTQESISLESELASSSLFGQGQEEAKHEDDPAGRSIFMGDVGVTPIDARDDKEKQRFIIGEREELVMRCVLQVASLLLLVFLLGFG
jgi:hypothetical protein